MTSPHQLNGDSISTQQQQYIDRDGVYILQTALLSPTKTINLIGVRWIISAGKHFGSFIEQLKK